MVLPAGKISLMVIPFVVNGVQPKVDSFRRNTPVLETAQMRWGRNEHGIYVPVEPSLHRLYVPGSGNLLRTDIVEHDYPSSALPCPAHGRSAGGKCNAPGDDNVGVHSIQASRDGRCHAPRGQNVEISVLEQHRPIQVLWRPISWAKVVRRTAARYLNYAQFIASCS
jgi:hypothetical protein